MTAERIKMKKLRELFRLKFDAKLTHRQIGRALNISPGTVSYYVQAANQVALGWPLDEALDDEALMRLLEPMAKQLRQKSSRYVKPAWDTIHAQLAQKHMTLMLLWEEYAKAYPTGHYSYSQFTRHYKAWCKQQRVTMRLAHAAGEKGFIDFAGTTIPIYCRKTGAIHLQASIFLMVLGLSHYTFAYACKSQQLSDWIEAHQRAFMFFGGCPQVLVPDNLKSGITDSCQFEPEANPTYADMAEHYGIAIIPARPYKPRDKAIVENAVLIASRWIIARLSKQRFYSLNALNNALAELLRALNHKPFQKRSGSRFAQFITLEKAALRKLPKQAYELATLTYLTVPPDYHLRLDGHYYSVPYTVVGEKVLCRSTQTIVEFFLNNTRIASHLRSFVKEGKTTVNSHMPTAHQQYQQWTPQVFLDWAEQTGAGVYQLAQLMMAEKYHPEQISKLHMGLKNLVKRFTKPRLNQACRRAIVLKCMTFKSIRSILEKGLDRLPPVQLVTSLSTQAHQNLRGAQYYQQTIK